tara:strand:- start:908 stop:1519 length:612 start_codon:yes stop_codon:yes gene_type:complete
MKTPKLTDTNKTKDRLLSLELLQEVWDMDTGRNIYRMTLLGRQLLDYCSLRLTNSVFGWELSPYAPKGDSDTWEDARQICMRHNILSDDETMLTSQGVEIVFGLIHLRNKPLLKEQTTKGKKSGPEGMNKLGYYMFKFMKLMNTLSKSAQKYDTATSNLGKSKASKGKAPQSSDFGMGAFTNPKSSNDPFGMERYWKKGKKWK